MYTINNGSNFESFNLKLLRGKKDTKVKSLRPSDPDKKLAFELTVDGTSFSGVATYGDDAVWIPCGDYGFKIVTDNAKYHSLEETHKNLQYLAGIETLMLPKVYWSEVVEADKESFVLAKVENISKETKGRIGFKDSYIPPQDRAFVEEHLPAATYELERCIRDLYNYRLLPEDEWHKPVNLKGGRIVDFHRFRHLPGRYEFPSNGKTIEELNAAYRTMVQRYADNLDFKGGQKWKGRIYQGFLFDNGASFQGYTSGGDMYDSYRKLPFIPLNKVKDKKVLDLGSNQGFFSFQAALHGAAEVTGVEITKQDLEAAEDIKGILGYDNITFLDTDAVKFVETTDDKYELIVAASVIHQIYNDLKGADDLLSNIASKCNYFAFETPVNHPTMRISLGEIHNILCKHFNKVRLVNIYDAYSSGYRANFVCYAHKIK